MSMSTKITINEPYTFFFGLRPYYLSQPKQLVIKKTRAYQPPAATVFSVGNLKHLIGGDRNGGRLNGGDLNLQNSSRGQTDGLKVPSFCQQNHFLFFCSGTAVFKLKNGKAISPFQGESRIICDLGTESLAICQVNVWKDSARWPFDLHISSC